MNATACAVHRPREAGTRDAHDMHTSLSRALRLPTKTSTRFEAEAHTLFAALQGVVSDRVEMAVTIAHAPDGLLFYAERET